MRSWIKIIAVFGLTIAAEPAAAQVVYSSSGTTAASITPTVSTFRNDIGPLNPNVAGSFGSGRREINWDGVPDSFSAPNALPGNFFNVNSPRGVALSTPGTGFQVSATAASGTPVEFGNINASYPDLFAVFSAQRLFTPVGSNITDVSFLLAGSNTPALVTGFGAIFTDVDLENSTTISFFDSSNILLGTYGVPFILGNQTFSFFGVLYQQPVIARVRITSGNAALGSATNETASTDLVAIDDFIFGEPRLAATAAVPEPATWATFLLGFAAIGWRMRRRRTVLNADAAARVGTECGRSLARAGTACAS